MRYCAKTRPNLTLDCICYSKEDAINIYQASEELKIIQSGYIWLTTQQAVEEEALQHAPTGKIMKYHSAWGSQIILQKYGNVAYI